MTHVFFIATKDDIINIDNNLYTEIENDKLLIIVVYVDDIIFGSNEESMSQNFASVIQQEFEMSSLGELTYFLGIQVQQTKVVCFFHKPNISSRS